MVAHNSNRGSRKPCQIIAEEEDDEEEADHTPVVGTTGKNVALATSPAYPFSKWRCLWSPSKAIDPTISEPYAVLEVKIERGFGLVASDITTSDPYCKLELNGQLTGHVTETIRQTLAPYWEKNQPFQVPIYHPLSIFSISVYDRDFGTALGDMDLLGLDDDFIGFLDLHIAKLPHNKKLHGWFELESSESYADSVLARKYKDSKYGCGSLLLELEMKVSTETSEVFALALPKPPEGHGLPALDMVAMFDHYADLKQYAADVCEKIQAAKDLVERFPHNRWALLIIAVFFVWNPSFLPAVIIFITDCAAWKLWFAALKIKRQRNGWGFCTSVCKSVTNAVRECHEWICTGYISIPHARKNSPDGIRQPLLDGDKSFGVSSLRDSSPHSRSRAIVSSDKHAQPDKAGQPNLARSMTPKHQQAHDMGTALSNLKPFMSGENKMDIRRVQKFMTVSSENVEVLDALMYEDAKLLILSVVLILLAIVLFGVHVWTGTSVQVVLTALICYAALKDCMVVRFLRGIVLHFSLRAKRRGVHYSIEEKRRKSGLTKVDKHTMRHLANIDMLHCWERCRRRRTKQVEFKTGIGHPHALVRTSYAELTWCDGCGRFLWGISKQGSQCRWCQQNFCKACSVDASSENGPRNCDAEVTDAPSSNNEADDTMSQTSATSSIMSRSDVGRLV